MSTRRSIWLVAGDPVLLAAISVLVRESPWGSTRPSRPSGTGPTSSEPSRAQPRQPPAQAQTEPQPGSHPGTHPQQSAAQYARCTAPERSGRSRQGPRQHNDHAPKLTCPDPHPYNGVTVEHMPIGRTGTTRGPSGQTRSGVCARATSYEEVGSYGQASPFRRFLLYAIWCFRGGSAEGAQ